MSTFVTPNMDMILPSVGSEPGQDYAYEINTALAEKIDIHDHTTGLGVKIPVAGLNINADFPVNINNVNNARSYRMNNSGVILNGAQDINQIYVFNGNLYFNNSSGIPIKLTNGSSINSTNTFYSVRAISATTTINSADTYVYYEIDCSINPITVTLPAANTVTAGRFYIFKDVKGNSSSNNITITANGFDLIDSTTSKVFNRNYEVMTLVCDGFGVWHADFGADYSWLNNTFGQSGNATSIVGSSIGISATGSGTITLGGSSNVLNFNGSSYTFGFNSGNLFTINAATTDIRGSQFNVYSTGGTYLNTNVNLGDSAADIITINGTSAFTADAFFGDDVIMNYKVDMNGDVNIGDNATDLLNVKSNATFNEGVTFNNAAELFSCSPFANFNGGMNLGGGVSDNIAILGTTRIYQASQIDKQMVNNGAGRQVPRVILNTPATNTNYSINNASIFVFRNTALSGNVTYTFQNTGAVVNDIIYFYIYKVSATGSNFHVILKDNGGGTLYDKTIFTGSGQQNGYAVIIYDGSGWVTVQDV